MSVWYFYIRSIYVMQSDSKISLLCIEYKSWVHTTKVCKKTAQPAEHYVCLYYIVHTYLLHFHIFHFHAPYRIEQKKNNVILSLFLPTQPFLLLKKICQKRLCSFYYIAMYVCGIMHRAAMFPSSSTSYVKYFFSLSRQIATRIMIRFLNFNLI